MHPSPHVVCYLYMLATYVASQATAKSSNDPLEASVIKLPCPIVTHGYKVAPCKALVPHYPSQGANKRPWLWIRIMGYRQKYHQQQQ